MINIYKGEFKQLREGEKSALSQVCNQIGEHFTSDIFEYDQYNWEFFFDMFTFENGYPELNIDEFLQNNFHFLYGSDGGGYSHIDQVEALVHEVKEVLRKRGDIEEDHVQELAQDVYDRAENYGVPNAIKQGVRSISQNLFLWVPLCDSGGIGQMSISGCDTDCENWKQFETFFRKYFCPSMIPDEKPAEWKSADFWMETFAGNASYGGDAGIGIPLDGNEFIDWVEGENLIGIVRSCEKSWVEVGVLTFGNGAGHLETLPMDLSDYQLPAEEWEGKTEEDALKETVQVGIINNFIDSVFGISGFSSLGGSYNDNTWVSVKKENS